MATREQKIFNAIGYILVKISGFFAGLVDLLWSLWVSPSSAASQDWVDDADWAKIQQSPLRPRALIYFIFIILCVLIFWASVAVIDEVARGEGTVIPSLQTQIIQSYDGGVVEEILIAEGQVVEKGELLLRIDRTRFDSSVQENRVQYLSVLATKTRLEALINDTEFMLPVEIIEEVPQVAQNERTLYFSSLEELEQKLSIAREQFVQREAELEEVQAKLNQSSRANEIAKEDLQATLPLLNSGAVSESEINRLELIVSNTSGEIEQAVAQLAQVRSAITEAEKKQAEVDLVARNEWGVDLSVALSDLAVLEESGLGLADRLKYADIRAPVRGTILRLFVNTVGGVVQPGKEVVELTPLDDQLLVEVKIAPRDIAFLQRGQVAIVKLTSYDFTTYGGLIGEVERIAVDTITNEQDETYYLVQVRTLESGFNQSLPIIPGMTSQVDIMTGKKTILSYLLKPILRAKQNALTER